MNTLNAHHCTCMSTTHPPSPLWNKPLFLLEPIRHRAGTACAGTHAVDDRNPLRDVHRSPFTCFEVRRCEHRRYQSPTYQRQEHWHVLQIAVARIQNPAQIMFLLQLKKRERLSLPRAASLVSKEITRLNFTTSRKYSFYTSAMMGICPLCSILHRPFSWFSNNT